MTKIERIDAPDWLDENWEAWGEEYIERLRNNPNYQFAWKQYEGERVNHRLLPPLKEMTHNHCSFCDGFPMGEGVIKETIEHFCPKGRNHFPYLVYCWENLFVACHFCQEKGEQFDENLLKPDLPDYEFEKYFLFNYRTFEIEIRKDISAESKLKAEVTMKFYKLNYSGREVARKREYKKFQNTAESEREINDYSYRYMFI